MCTKLSEPARVELLRLEQAYHAVRWRYVDGEVVRVRNIRHPERGSLEEILLLERVDELRDNPQRDHPDFGIIPVYEPSSNRKSRTRRLLDWFTRDEHDVSSEDTWTF